MSKEEKKYYHVYMHRWDLGETPINWVTATPIKIFGYFLGYKVKMRYNEYTKELIKNGEIKYHE